ncbi:hypothetical protein LTR70_004445 [Exophiala xenobiotica]|uniref:Uncharacterized protein n=1 Tax=Lithohypha guttulata TaxID=1690604 RepID=A0ABR0KDI8_9EURO|nr:hypothetical protein LTR24_003923 [Lithohypha guttulata]KAK5320867.1 hypothetical protein LTR70_004445 [Exophiala xenobiotica]
MSHTPTLPIPSRPHTQRRIVDVIDHSNIDDFFRDPSPHELSVTAQMEVVDIIEDLQRRTAEELENWRNPGAVAELTEHTNATSTKTNDSHSSSTEALFVSDDMLLRFEQNESVPSFTQNLSPLKPQQRHKRIHSHHQINLPFSPSSSV